MPMMHWCYLLVEIAPYFCPYFHAYHMNDMLLPGCKSALSMPQILSQVTRQPPLMFMPWYDWRCSTDTILGLFQSLGWEWKVGLLGRSVWFPYCLAFLL